MKRPTKEELMAAKGERVKDVIAMDLKCLFCGINPGQYTAWIGHHFGRPGNRFWRAVYKGGFTPRLLTPFEEIELLKYGYGITNLVQRATLTASEVSREELEKGKDNLVKKISKYLPKAVAVLGVTAYRNAFGQKSATIGLQKEKIEQTRVWVLPNPSGLNTHYTPADLAELFSQLKKETEMIEFK